MAEWTCTHCKKRFRSDPFGPIIAGGCLAMAFGGLALLQRGSGVMLLLAAVAMVLGVAWSLKRPKCPQCGEHRCIRIP